MRRRIVGAVIVGMMTLAATGCSSDDDGGTPSSNASPAVVDITVKGDQITPNGDRVDVAVGQEIQLKVTADKPGEIHVHSDPEHEFEYKAGTESFNFIIDRPGVVVVESHSLDKTIVQLEVR